MKCKVLDKEIFRSNKRNQTINNRCTILSERKRVQIQHKQPNVSRDSSKRSQTEKMQVENLNKKKDDLWYQSNTSFSPTKAAKTLLTKNQGLCKEMQGCLGHGTRCRHNQLKALDSKLLKTAVELYSDPIHAPRQQNWRKQHEAPEVQSQIQELERAWCGNLSDQYIYSSTDHRWQLAKRHSPSGRWQAEILYSLSKPWGKWRIPHAECICHPTWQTWPRVERDVDKNSKVKHERATPCQQKWDPSQQHYAAWV